MTPEEHNRQLTAYLQTRCFGLIAYVEKPSPDEHYPIASATIINTDIGCVLLTVAHYLRDVKRWVDEKRLTSLHLLVNSESGIIRPIPLDLDKNPGMFMDVLDFGFMVLDDDVVSEVSKAGGNPIKTENVSTNPEEMDRFFLVGQSAHYTTLSRETIARSAGIEYQLVRPRDFALLISRLAYETTGPTPGTYRFALLKGYDDYRGTSGGPIFAFRKGSLIRDYFFFAIQASQILAGARDQKPTHLIATSAPLVLHVLNEYIRELQQSATQANTKGAKSRKQPKVLKKERKPPKKKRRGNK